MIFFIISIDSKSNYRQTTLHFVVLLKNKTIARGLQKGRNNQSARYVTYHDFVALQEITTRALAD